MPLLRSNEFSAFIKSKERKCTNLILIWQRWRFWEVMLSKVKFQCVDHVTTKHLFRTLQLDIFLPIYPEIHLHKVYSPLVLCIFQNCGEFFHPKLPIDKNDIPYVPRLSEKDKKKFLFIIVIILIYNTYLIDLDKWAYHIHTPKLFTIWFL